MNASAALLDYEPQLSVSGLRRTEPKVETYSYVAKERLASRLALTVLPLFAFSLRDEVKRLREPLLLRVTIEQGEYFVENDALRIFGNGATLHVALDSFSRDLAYFWEYYGGLRDDQVAGDAVRLKRLYEELVA